MLFLVGFAENPQVSISIENKTRFIASEDEVFNKFSELFAGLVANPSVLLSNEQDGTDIILKPTELLCHRTLAVLQCCCLCLDWP